MKKLNILLVLVLLFSMNGYAQITLTPRVGTTFSTIAFSDLIEEDLETGNNKQSAIGFIAGAEVGFGISDMFSIQTGLNFTQKGTEYELGGVTSTITTNYLEIPLLARVHFGSDKIKGYVNAGPSLGLGLNGKVKAEGFGVSFEEDITFGDGDGEDDFFENSIDLGLQFGAGIGYLLGPGQIVLDLRYGLGLSNLFETPDGFDRSDFKSTNNVFAISLGYAIPLGGQ